MLINNLWLWFLVGLIPYYVTNGWLLSNVQRIEVRAVFWTLTVWRRRGGSSAWVVRIPLIEWLRGPK